MNWITESHAKQMLAVKQEAKKSPQYGETWGFRKIKKKNQKTTLLIQNCHPSNPGLHHLIADL